MSLVRCSGSRLHEPCSHLTRFPGQTKCKLRAAHTRAICKYSRNPWCRLAFDGNVLALTANEITPPLTGRLQPKADNGNEDRFKTSIVLGTTFWLLGSLQYLALWRQAKNEKPTDERKPAL